MGPGRIVRTQFVSMRPWFECYETNIRTKSIRQIDLKKKVKIFREDNVKE